MTRSPPVVISASKFARPLIERADIDGQIGAMDEDVAALAAGQEAIKSD
jgi:hypothetical protein